MRKLALSIIALSIVFLALISIARVVFAEDTKKAEPVTIALTDEESKAINKLVGQYQQAAKRADDKAQAALSVPLENREDALAALGAWQSAAAFKVALGAQLEAMLAKHQLSHSCGDCVGYSDDFKSLVKRPRQ